MGSVSSVLGVHGAPLTVEHEGATYTASPIIQRVRSAFERWLQKRAAAVLEDLSQVLSREAFSPLVKEHAREVASGVYAFGGEVCEAALKTPQGVLSFAGIVFGVSDDTMETLLQKKGVEVNIILETLLAESTQEQVSEAGPEGNVSPGKPG